jgi:hypothetical protein
VGALDEVTVTGRRVAVRGWVWDPDLPAGPLAAVAGAAGRNTLAPAGRWRPELAYFGISPFSGVESSVELPPGTHQVCLWALDHDGSRYTGTSAVAGCRQVVVK